MGIHELVAQRQTNSSRKAIGRIGQFIVGMICGRCGVIKLWSTEYGEDVTMIALDDKMGRLGLEYIDLLYIHQPIGDYIGAWKDMERTYEQENSRTRHQQLRCERC